MEPAFPVGLPPPAPAAAVQPEPGKKQRAPAKPRAKKPKTDAAADGAAGDGGAGQPGSKAPRRAAPKTKGGQAQRGGGGRSKKGKGKGKEVDGDLDELVGKDEALEEELEEAMGPSHRDIFAKELPNLMYGFGDSSTPLQESVHLLEDMAVEYITDIVHKAMAVVHKRCAAAVAARGGSMPAPALKREEQLKLDDLLYVLRNDPRKYARVRHLLEMQEAIKNARALTKDQEGMLGEGADNMPDLDDNMPV